MIINVAQKLAYPIERVWFYIGDFGGLQRWHPHVRSCRLETAQGETLRIVELDGWHAIERLTAFDPVDYVLGYEMMECGRAVLTGVRGTMRLEPLTPARCLLRWESELPEGAPAELAGLLQAYYPERIGHLREALARAD